MESKKIAATITSGELATLLQRAIDGKLSTGPNKQFTKRELDSSTSKGTAIRKFLQHPDKDFPVKVKDDRVKRIQFILDTLEKAGCNLSKELDDIRTNSTNATESPQKEKKDREVIHNMPQSTVSNEIVNTESAPNKVTELEALIGDQKNLIAQLEDDKKKLLDQCDLLQSQCALLQSQRALLQSRYASLQNQYDLLQSQYNSLNQKHNDSLTGQPNLLNQQSEFEDLQKQLEQERIIFAKTLAKIQLANQAELDQLRNTIGTLDSSKYMLFGLRIGKIIQKFTRPNGQVRVSPCWYAYAPNNKKIFLGCGDVFDRAKFESKLRQKGYGTPQIKPSENNNPPPPPSLPSSFEVNPVESEKCLPPKDDQDTRQDTNQDASQDTNQESTQNH